MNIHVLLCNNSYRCHLLTRGRYQRLCVFNHRNGFSCVSSRQNYNPTSCNINCICMVFYSMNSIFCSCSWRLLFISILIHVDLFLPIKTYQSCVTSLQYLSSSAFNKSWGKMTVTSYSDSKRVRVSYSDLSVLKGTTISFQQWRFLQYLTLRNKYCYVSFINE